MIPVIYNYHCDCGYHCVQHEKVQADAYIRILVHAVLLCPECKEQLQPQVLVAYASRGTNEIISQGTEQDKQEEAAG